MLKYKELADPNSCLNKADPEEPIFVLRAHDPLAPDLIRLWAKQYAQEFGFAAYELTEVVAIERTLAGMDRAWFTEAALVLQTPLSKYREALECADMMEKWYNNHA